MNDQLRERLTSLTVGEPVTFRGLTFFALLDRDAELCGRYSLLADAIHRGVAELTEVSDTGSVPELMLVNRGEQPVLLFDGEELVGAKQNRTTNVTVLAAGNSTTRIPVTCVEAGRWEFQSRSFASSRQMHFHGGRRSKLAQVNEELLNSGRFTASQHEVWSDIDRLAEQQGVCSDTVAMSDVFDAAAERLGHFEEVFAHHADQVGVAVAIGSDLVGIEIFDSPASCRVMLPKLVRSYAIEPCATGESAPVPCRCAVRRLLEQLLDDQPQTVGAIGLGTNLRFTGPRIIGSVVQVDEHLVHLVGFVP